MNKLQQTEANSAARLFSSRWRACNRMLTMLLMAHAGSSWADCNAAIEPNITAEQYVVHSDSSVTDVATGLTWMRCPVGYAWSEGQSLCVHQDGSQTLFTWPEALEYAANAGEAGGTVWRLPNSKELETLLKRNCFDPAIEVSVFSSAALSNHWSSTAAVGYDGSAWAVDFGWGSHITTPVDTAFQIRLVRDAE